MATGLEISDLYSKIYHSVAFDQSLSKDMRYTLESIIDNQSFKDKFDQLSLTTRQTVIETLYENYVRSSECAFIEFMDSTTSFTKALSDLENIIKDLDRKSTDDWIGSLDENLKEVSDELDNLTEQKKQIIEKIIDYAGGTGFITTTIGLTLKNLLEYSSINELTNIQNNFNLRERHQLQKFIVQIADVEYTVLDYANKHKDARNKYTYNNHNLKIGGLLDGLLINACKQDDAPEFDALHAELIEFYNESKKIYDTRGILSKIFSLLDGVPPIEGDELENPFTPPAAPATSKTPIQMTVLPSLQAQAPAQVNTNSTGVVPESQTINLAPLSPLQTPTAPAQLAAQAVSVSTLVTTDVPSVSKKRPFPFLIVSFCIVSIVSIFGAFKFLTNPNNSKPSTNAGGGAAEQQIMAIKSNDNVVKANTTTTLGTSGIKSVEVPFESNVQAGHVTAILNKSPQTAIAYLNDHGNEIRALGNVGGASLKNHGLEAFNGGIPGEKLSTIAGYVARGETLNERDAGMINATLRACSQSLKKVLLFFKITKKKEIARHVPRLPKQYYSGTICHNFADT